jgi:hypothetical protein
MNPNNYNPKAREAFAKSLIDIGVAIFKGIVLLLYFTRSRMRIKVARIYEFQPPTF